MRRFPLGSYPTMGVSEARTQGRALHARVKHEGADPVAERKRERAAAAAREGVGTLAAIPNLYGEKRGNTQKAWAEARKRIDLIFAPLLTRPAETLTYGVCRPAAATHAGGARLAKSWGDSQVVG